MNITIDAKSVEVTSRHSEVTVQLYDIDSAQLETEEICQAIPISDYVDHVGINEVLDAIGSDHIEDWLKAKQGE